MNADVEIGKEIQSVEIYELIGFLGGSLGLFLGFSCLSTLRSFSNFLNDKLKALNPVC